MDRTPELNVLLVFCKKGGRVCPKPDYWHRLWEMLPDRKRVGGGWSPPLPLILGGWWESSDLEKQHRLEEHVRWAHTHGILENVDNFIRSLSEEQWHHSDE